MLRLNQLKEVCAKYNRTEYKKTFKQIDLLHAAYPRFCPIIVRLFLQLILKEKLKKAEKL